MSEDKIAMDDYDRRRGEGLKLPEEDVALKFVIVGRAPRVSRPPRPCLTFSTPPCHRAPPPPAREGNEWLRHTQAMSGPAMMFVSLKPRDPEGRLWTKKKLDKLSAEWSSMCKTAGLEAKVYDISEGAQDTPTRTRRPSGSVSATPTPTLPPARMLVSMNSGWRGYDLRDFMLRRPELESLEWDQVKYTPDDLDADGNFKGGVTGKNAAPLPAGLADMAAKPPPSKKGGKGAAAGGKAKPTPPPRRRVEEEEEEEEDDDAEF